MRGGELDRHLCSCCLGPWPLVYIYSACSLVGFWAGLDWLMLVYCERKTLLAGWFGLAETNKRTGRMSLRFF